MVGLGGLTLLLSYVHIYLNLWFSMLTMYVVLSTYMCITAFNHEVFINHQSILEQWNTSISSGVDIDLLMFLSTSCVMLVCSLEIKTMEGNSSHSKNPSQLTTKM